MIARAARAVTLAALVAGAALSTAAAEADTGIPGRIAYASDDALIHTVEGDGTRLKTVFDRLTGQDWSALALRDPASSPDGRKLVFTGESATDSRIGVLEDGRVTTVARATAAIKGLQQPAFSADGKKVVFRALGAEFSLYTVAATGGTPVKVSLGAQYRDPAEPAYSPDGRLLAFSALDANGDRRVYLKNLETEQVTQLTSGGSGQAFPAFSPDGANVAYMNIPLATGGGAGHPQLAVRPVAGGAQDILWSDERSLLGRPAYSPDGKRVAFAVSRAAGQACAADVMVIDTDGVPNPRAIACASTTEGGSVDWAVRAAQGVVKLASSLPGSEREAADGDTTVASIAGSGRYEVFSSTASNLTAGTDDNDKADVFVRDLIGGGTTHISATSTGGFPHGTSDEPIISADGAYVAFRSDARDVLPDFNGGTTAVYVRSAINGGTQLASRRREQLTTAPSGDNRPVAISKDGRFVLFASTSDDVIGDPQGENPGDTDTDLFRWDRLTEKTAIVTVKAGTLLQAANAGTGRALMSADGNTVVFESTATDLVPGFVDHNGAAAPSLFARDLATNTTTLLDGRNGSATESSDKASALQAISADGKAVLIRSGASDLIEHFTDGNGAEGTDLYLRKPGSTTLVTSAGVAADHGANATVGDATISADGTRVFFSSKGTDLNGEFTVTGEQVWMRTAEGPAVLVSRGLAPDHGADGDSTLVDTAADGKHVLIRSSATDLSAPLTHHDAPALYRVDTATLEAEPVSARGADANDAAPTAGPGAISADGNTIAWTSRATNLIDGFADGNGPENGDAFAWIERATALQDPIAPTIEIKTPVDDQVYRDDKVVLADYECADEGPSGLASCDGPVPAGTPLDFSRTGSFSFTVTARDNAGNVATETVHYRVASANKKLSLASRSVKDALTTGDGESWAPVYSADGRYLVFTSYADDLMDGFIDGNGNEGADVFRRDLNTGVTELVSAGLARPGDNGRPRGANEDAQATNAGQVISPDGRYVLFASDARNLIDGLDAPYGTQLYLRDMQTGTTKLVTHRAQDNLPGGPANPGAYGFSGDGRTVVFTADANGLVAGDGNADTDVFTYSMATGALTLVSVEASGRFSANRGSARPAISADGRRVLFETDATNLLAAPLDDTRLDHLYWRDLDAGTTKLVDHRFDRAGEPAATFSDGAKLSADGRIVLFATRAGDVIEGYGGREDDPRVAASQLYLRDMTTDGPATLVSSAFNAPKLGTGGEIDDAELTRDGRTVVWYSMSKRVIENFVDLNDKISWDPGGDLFRRSFEGTTPAGPATLAAHDGQGPNFGITFDAHIRALSDNGRYLAVHVPTPECDCGRYVDTAARVDLKRNRFNFVLDAANRALGDLVMSADGRRLATMTAADNLLSGFADANGLNNSDVFAWYDAPPTAAATSKTTGSLKLSFDASESADPDGEIERFEWDFGDGKSATGEHVEHTYDEEKGYTVKLTIEDDGGNEVSTSLEVVALKGILTTGPAPIDFIGVDKHLRCSVVRGGALFANGSGYCGTFVALDGKTYGPPELIDGTTDYTPVSQALSSAGDTTTLVTVVALGETGVRVRQTDAYTAGKPWYRTDVELLNDTGDAKTATVYRASRCAMDGSRSLHDPGTSMAGCDGSLATGTRTLAAWLPLSAGAHRDAGDAQAILARIAAGRPLTDTCNCGDQADPAAAIGWPVELPAGAGKRLGSLGAFGPDGSIPLTLDLAADKAQVQPLDENAFTVTLRNANAGEKAVPELVVAHEAAWDVIPGSTTGLTTADPAVAGDVNTWTALKVAGHGGGTLRFGVTHRSGQRTAKTTATPGTDSAWLGAGTLAEQGSATASVVARADGTAKPNTAITSGPAGMTTDRDPAFKLEASKDDVRYECRFGSDPWAPCEGNPHRPGPLADGPYTLEARAVDAVGADETPAKRSFVIDTAAPNTTLSSGPRGTIRDNRPGFFFGADETGARFECRLNGGAWFACEAPTYRPAALADGTYTFEVRAVDAAGNPDPSPAAVTFTVDTTPPVTVIDAITAKVIAAARSAAPTVGGAGSANVALGEDGAAALDVACPAGGPACQGAVGLGMTPASAAQVKAAPANTITLARTEFTAQPGRTVRVRLPLSMAVRNQVDRIGRMAVFTTLDLGTGRMLRGSDVVLTPDPRTARLLDAGNELRVRHGRVKLRLACAAGCRGTVKAGSAKAVRFSIHRRGSIRVPVKQAGRDVAVLIKTRLAPAKRLTLTLRAQEARR